MGKATIVIEDRDEEISVRVSFDPPLRGLDTKIESYAQQVGVTTLNFISKLVNGDGENDE